MKKLNPKTCLLCGSSRYEIRLVFKTPDVYEQKVGVKEKGYARQWVQCKDCGLIYSQYSRDSKVIHKIYKTAYRSQDAAWRSANTRQMFEKVTRLPETESETKFRVKWIKTRIAALKADGVLRDNREGGDFLDIGGGNGIFAYEFQDSRWRPHVIDPDENGRFVQDELQIPFVQDYYKSQSFLKKFDLMTLIFVLEHIAKPDQLLKNIRRDMREGLSLVYIEVPDMICFNVKDPTDDIFNSCHLWMFGPESLTRLLNSCGFEVFALDRMKTKRGHMALTVLAGLKTKTPRVST